MTTFPENVPRNQDGFIDFEWLRYNNDWRHGVRQWQNDLEAGRLDPEWQRQAAIAMEERAAGMFDQFKENEFEAFWGQKQKMDMRTRAGKSKSFKLEDLLAAGLFKEGDFLVYSRAFKRDGIRTEVVKDCEVYLTIIWKIDLKLTYLF